MIFGWHFGCRVNAGLDYYLREYVGLGKCILHVGWTWILWDQRADWIYPFRILCLMEPMNVTSFAITYWCNQAKTVSFGIDVTSLNLMIESFKLVERQKYNLEQCQMKTEARLEWCCYKPKKLSYGGIEQIIPQSPGRAQLLTPCFWASGLLNCESKYLVMVCHYGRPRKLQSC